MKEDWIECAVENIGQVITGGTPSKKRPEFYSQDDYPFYKPTDLNAGINVSKSKDYLSSLGFESSRKASKNSILVTCIGATIGKTGLVKKEGAFNQQINALLPNKGMSNIFLYYQIIGSVFQQQIKRNASSTTLPILNKSKFLKLKLKIPPYLIQQAIVNKIEALFSSLDSGIADLKKAQEQLKIYRQAVLKKAFEGELTKEWRELQMMNDEWENVQLKDVLIQSKEKHKPEKIENLFYVGLEHIEKETGNLTETVDFEEIKTVKNKFQEGQILYGKLRPYLNKVHLAKRIGVCSTDILVFSPTEKIYDKYALLFMLSREFVNDMSNNTNGVNLPRVSTKYVNEYNIPLPSLIEQHQIVQEIESRLSVCDAVQLTITESLEKAQALRQSILKKAFEGKLLSEEEIAKCKADKDYEPASVLLEKMKTEKKKK